MYYWRRWTLGRENWFWIWIWTRAYRIFLIVHLDEWSTRLGGPVEWEARLEWSSRLTSLRLLARMEALTLCLLPMRTLLRYWHYNYNDRTCNFWTEWLLAFTIHLDKKLYLAVFEMKGELPDIITALSLSLKIDLVVERNHIMAHELKLHLFCAI